jgi:hypothetical protein
MALPGFIGVGAAKCGTTMLYQIMLQHKDIFIPKEKECHFFNSDEMYSYGAHYYESRFFADHANEKAVGEITPLYMLYDEVPARIHKTLGPDVKLIFCFRNPAKRAFSNYLQNVRMLWEGEGFEMALELEAERIADDYRFGLVRAYIHGGYYSQQLENFLGYFPRQNMFFIVFEEDLLNNKKDIIADLFNFLGVDWDSNINLNVSGNKSTPPKLLIVKDKPIFYVKNNRKYKLPTGSIVYTTGFPGIDRVIVNPSDKTAEYFNKLEKEMTKEINAELVNDLMDRYFLDDIKRLETMIDRDLSAWYGE